MYFIDNKTTYIILFVKSEGRSTECCERLSDSHWLVGVHMLFHILCAANLALLIDI